MHFSISEALSLEAFKKMDEMAVSQYALPIALMMENAGLILAKLIANHASKQGKILIGVGNGNNGGGGLVAARRLAGWGYNVFLDMVVPLTKELPLSQYRRALLFGAVPERIPDPAVWVDAYLGFSQRLPLSAEFEKAIAEANTSEALKVALDLPTGILSKDENKMFQADKVLTLAAPKEILNRLPASTEILIADIGIPAEIYKEFKIEMPKFYDHGIT
ncbi:MAG: NAD(P)H-hydrate epimerase [Flavobacteriaceae bacterium]